MPGKEGEDRTKERESEEEETRAGKKWISEDVLMAP
jgi:hypothetical protein